MKKIVLGIGIIAIIIFVSFWFSPAMKLKRDNPTFDFPSQDTTFLNNLITNGVDQIDKYIYQGKTYYHTRDREFIAADGWPKVYGENGTEIDCQFGSPMVPKDKKPLVNPICANENTQTSVNIYTRK